MTNIPSRQGINPVRKAKVRGRKQRVYAHKDWAFQPRLKNEAVVLHSILNHYDISFYDNIVSDIRTLVEGLIRNHGFTDGPKRYNVIKQYTINLIEYRNPENPGWLATSRIHGIPSKLGINCVKLIVDYLNCTDSAMQKKYYQAIITILSIPRIIEGLSEPDYKSVTDKAKPIDPEILSGFSTYVEKKLSRHVFKPEKVILSSIKINFKKNGPNGKPKLESAPDEAVSLLKDKQLSKPFKIFCEGMGVNHLYSYVSKLAKQVTDTEMSDLSSEHKAPQTKLRKLVPVPDSGMKTRIVAIVDFWTQLVLEPFRDHVQNVIERLYENTDFRKDQDRGVATMVEFQKRCIANEVIGDHVLDIQHMKFYDISSWTDRFHRDLQKIVVSKLFSPRISQAWSQLTVHCEWNVGNSDRTVKYGQGQGMGTNGSFDVATLTDHLYIGYMYEVIYSGFTPYGENCYGKVGDDLWIYDPQDRYPEMCEKINLPINFSKSKSYSKIGSIAEFCSRTFIDGVDVSRISPKIISRSTNFRFLPTLLSYCCSRGIQLNRMSFPYLDLKVKDRDCTYFDMLQPWIISTFVVSSENYSHLTIDYLVAGNWVSEESEKIIRDPATLIRIKAAFSLKKIAEFNRDIENKITEVQEAEGPLEMEDVFMLSLGEHDAFDPESSLNSIMLDWWGSSNEVLDPKQIFVMNRYITQTQLVTNEFYELYSLDPNSENYFSEAKELLEEISTRSVYDRGNLNYDMVAFRGMQFSIVKTLQCMDSEFTILRLAPEELKSLVFLEYQGILEQGNLRDIIRVTADDSLTV